MRAGLDIDRRFDPVSAFEIRDQLIREIANARPVVDMVVGVDDPQVGFERRFLGERAHVSKSSGASFSGSPSSKVFSVSATRL